MTTTTTEEVAETYLTAWLAGDADTLRGLMADDVTFEGPLARLDNVDDCVQGLVGLAEIITDVDVKKRVVDGDDVITWFDLHTKVADPAPTANWTHLEDGRITAIRVAFDPRGLLAAGDD